MYVSMYSTIYSAFFLFPLSSFIIITFLSTPFPDFLQIRSLGTSELRRTVLVHEWSELIRLSLTPLVSPDLMTVELVATSMMESASGQLMASIIVNISWNNLSSDINIDKYQIWVGSKALKEYEEPTSDGTMTKFEVHSYILTIGIIVLS